MTKLHLRGHAIHPDFVLPAPDELRLCEGCGQRLGREVHHREHKAMGGRHGAARKRSEGAANKILLCHTCHAASHYEHHIEPDGFHCGRCRLLETCRYGLITVGRSVPNGLAPRW